MLGIRRITGAADLAPEDELGSWVSDAAREKFMVAYKRAFALWPQPCEELDIETATTTTRVHAFRPHHGEPKFPGILTDGELRAITVPALLVTGARSALITRRRPAHGEASCRTRRSPSSPAATAASAGSMN